MVPYVGMGIADDVRRIIESEEDGIVNLEGKTFILDKTIELDKRRTRWTVIENATFIAKGFPALLVPLYREDGDLKTIRNITFRGEGIGAINRCSRVSWERCMFDKLNVGLDLRGANLNVLWGCYFNKCRTGLRMQVRDNKRKVPGNANKMFGCYFWYCTRKAMHCVKDPKKGSPGNGWSLESCTIEGTTDLLDIEDGVATTITGCRFELNNPSDKKVCAIKYRGAYLAQVHRNQFFLANKGTGTVVGVETAKRTRGVTLSNNMFMGDEGKGQIVFTKGPTIRALNWNVPD